MDERIYIHPMKAIWSGLWKASVNPVTFVVLSILWCLDLAGGSVAAYFDDPQFWQKMDAYPFNLWLRDIAPKTFPLSLWVYILVALSYLMILSLFLCTVNWFMKRRKRPGSFGEVLVHLGFLLVFAGFVGGSVFGSRTIVLLEEGRTVPVPETEIRVKLEALEVVPSPQGRPLDTLSDVAVFDRNGGVTRGTVRTNHPLIKGSTVVYPPQQYESGVTGGILGTSTSGAVTLKTGRDVLLTDGRVLSLAGILQDGQRRGGAVGPGILVLVKERGGRTTGAAYLSGAPGMQNSADLGGVKVTLGQLLETSRGMYRVHYDPGVWLVIVGSVVLALGTVWALAVFMGTDRN